MTVSVGVSAYSDKMQQMSLIVDTADSALYQAKKQGHNKSCRKLVTAFELHAFDRYNRMKKRGYWELDIGGGSVKLGLVDAAGRVLLARESFDGH